jgi:hypothetical protein
MSTASAFVKNTVNIQIGVGSVSSRATDRSLCELNAGADNRHLIDIAGFYLQAPASTNICIVNVNFFFLVFFFFFYEKLELRR